MEEFELINQWLIDWEKTSELDYKLGSDNPIEIPYNKNKNNYFYNQGKLRRTRNACVLYANAAALWYTMNYEFSEKELLEIVDLAEKEYWWEEDKWMYISNWVDCVRNYWNKKFPSRKVKTFKMEVWDEDFARALRNNYRVVVWYRTCRDYYKDSQDDWIIEWTEFWPFRWGHCVSSIFWKVKTISENDGILIEDNYDGSKKYNEYYNNKISILKKTWTYFPSAFIYLKEEEIESELEKNIDLEKAVEWYKLWLWNWLNPRKPASRQEVITMIMNAIEKLK